MNLIENLVIGFQMLLPIILRPKQSYHRKEYFEEFFYFNLKFKSTFFTSISHAGYAFCGPCAAHAYKQIDFQSTYVPLIKNQKLMKY